MYLGFFLLHHSLDKKLSKRSDLRRQEAFREKAEKMPSYADTCEQFLSSHSIDQLYHLVSSASLPEMLCNYQTAQLFPLLSPCFCPCMRVNTGGFVDWVRKLRGF